MTSLLFFHVFSETYASFVWYVLVSVSGVVNRLTNEDSHIQQPLYIFNYSLTIDLYQIEITLPSLTCCPVDKHWSAGG